MNPISPVTALVDKADELLGHSPHPGIVAVPIGAWTVSNLCDGMALVTGDDRYDAAAQISMGIGLVGAAGAIVTGLRDYSHIDRDKPSHDVATTHAIGNAVVSALYTASYILRSRDVSAGRRTGWLPRVLGLAGGGLSLYTAWLGGVLVEEMGEGVKPVMARGEEHHGRERLAPSSPLGVRHGA